MSWTRFRDHVGQWGPMASCALLSLAAFYLLILYGASLSKVILLGVMLVCPAVYFIAWLMGGNYGDGRHATLVTWEEDAVRKQVTWSQQPAPLPVGSGPK